MQKLIRGILDFRKNVLPNRRDMFARLATGQAPDTLFITCSDSRVAPNWFASSDPGDLFVIRNVGNLVPPYNEKSNTDHSVAAAIEFSILNLKISHILVCGHSGCGAMHALTNGIAKLPQSGLKDWLNIGEQSLDSSLDIKANLDLSYEDQLSQRSALQQIENLKTYPKVQEGLREGKLKLHAWWFDIAVAGVHAFDDQSRQFILIDETTGVSLLEN